MSRREIRVTASCLSHALESRANSFLGDHTFLPLLLLAHVLLISSGVQKAMKSTTYM